MKRNKLLLLLALLMTAATGAWAQDTYKIDAVYTFTANGQSQPEDLSIDDAASLPFTKKLSELDPYSSSWKENSLDATYITVSGDNIEKGTDASWDTEITINGAGTAVVSYAIQVPGFIDVGSATITFTVTKNEAASATYKVTMKDGVKDADKWTVKVGEGQAQALPIGGLKGDGSETVTLQYNGRLKVKGVKATSDAAPGPFDNVTISDIGKVIGADGNIYADAAAATAASTTAVAMIAYVGSDAETNTKYNHGLALALTDASTSAKWDTNTNRYCLSPYGSSGAAVGDMAGIANTDAIVKDGHTHAAASSARNYKSGTHPDGTSEWFLPSAGQWNKMITTAGGGAQLRTKAGLASDGYWSSTESSQVEHRAFYYNFSNNGWYNGAKTDEKHVRAVLAF